ncbi:organic cation/carnitine transporter 3-like [Nicotiana tabacum]|uniref:Organic cation/carnitine transporter 3-like n=1 Tax=Nicotiana tabacum TaxID=4097 RepID=A0A1S3XUM3_TOBAC|nr:PREDICTED: organic cation/carnitine transporter 3-like [Nicotiana tabacum]
MVEPSLSWPIIERCIMQGDEFGNWAQFLQAILVSLAWFFDVQQTFISAFTDAQPSWHCTSPPPPSSSSSSDCNSFNKNVCNLPKDSWAWDLAAHTSVISEWSLQCDGSIITGLPASSFFMGRLTELGCGNGETSDGSRKEPSVPCSSQLVGATSGFLLV